MTDLATSPRSGLVGEHVELWPYVRELLPGDVLYKLWLIMEEERAFEKLFHDVPTKQFDVSDLSKFFNRPSVALFLVQNIKEQELVGAIWFDDIIPQYRAFASIFMRRKYWGDMTEEASHMALRYIFDVAKSQSVWVSSPWKIAVRHAESLGFKIIAVLPGLSGTPEKPLDITILKLAKEQYDG